MRIPNITGFYPADPSNYTKGRGKAIRCFTVHHSAGTEQTLRYLWSNPARNGSSTFYVSGTVREQYVDTDDTPWTNGNWSSNQESLTCEVRGDWRNGYYDQATLNNLTEVMYQCLKKWPNLVLNYHNDVAQTICPADLKNKGYAAKCWANAKARIKAEQAPVVTPASINYEPITPKRVKLTRTANLWDFNFTEWSKAKAIDSYQAGHLIDVVAVATNKLGGKYYMTAYSYDEGRIRATNGFNTADCVDYVPPTSASTTKPTESVDVFVPSTPTEPAETPAEEPAQTPLDTDPTTPGEGDIAVRVTILEQLVKKIIDFLASIFTGFKK